MKMLESTVKRPVATSMLYLAILLLSVFAFSKLKVDFLPDFSFPTLTVITTYTNVGPQEIEETLTRRIEEVVSTVQNVKKVKCTSAEGMSLVSIEFEWGTDMSEAAADVRDKLDQVKKYLPDAADRSIVFKFDMSMIPVMAMVIETDNVGLTRIYADNNLRTEFEQVPGVAQVRIQGGSDREIQIRVKRDRLNAFKLTFNDIVNTIATENINTPGGEIDIDRDSITLRTVGEYRKIEEIKKVIVAVRELSQIPVGLREIVSSGYNRRIPIYIENVADVVDSYKEKTLVQAVNNQEGLVLLFQKQSGANTVEVVKAIRAKYERIKSRIPRNMKLYELFNTGDRITRSISNVSDSALIGGVIVLLVLFLFLRNIRTTIVVGIAMPISIIATFLLMYMNNITLNMMSFGGLALGVGMLVDNAVVVLENIYRHREKGESPTFAAIIGTREVAMPISSSTFTTVCVFIPVLFIKGISGVLFKEMALTVTFSLLSSLVVAITLIPMLASKFMTDKMFAEKKGIFKWLNTRVSNGLNRMDNFYSKVINWVLNHRKTVIWGAIVALFLSFQLCRVIPKGFMPEEERDDFFFDMELKQGTRIERTLALSQQVATMINTQVKGVRFVSSRAGTGDDFFAIFLGKSGSHLATIRVVLYERSDPRRVDMFTVRTQIRKLIAKIPGARIIFYRPNMMSSTASPVEVQIFGQDINTGMDLAKKVEKIINSVQNATDVEISRKTGKKEYVIQIDRIKASSLGLSVKSISDTINIGFAGKVASKFREGGDEYDINVRLREGDRLDEEDLRRLFVRSPLGFNVPLIQVARIQPGYSPVTIERLSQQRVIYVSANVTTDLERVVTEIQKRINAQLYPLPEGFSIHYGSEFQDQQESFKDLGIAFIIAMLLVYMVMAAQFESIKHPLIILLTIPLSLIGVILMFFFLNAEFNIMGYLGAIILVGIVVNNAIVLIDYTNLLRRDHGYSLREAIITGGKTRLRPILMTTLTTILGLVPMAFFGGEGSETRAPMAQAIVGGLTTSTLLTLVVIPIVYYIVENMGIKKRKMLRKLEEFEKKES